MTLDELKSKVTFSKRPSGIYEPHDLHRANINVTVEITVDRRGGMSMEMIKQRLTDELLHRLYANRQREFAELLEQHALANPMTNEYHDSRRKLIGMARSMVPKDE